MEPMEILQAQKSPSHDDAQSRLPITACLRCRKQKLKCGRERPTCARCHRLDERCSYPPPPDRRGPRSRRRLHLLGEGIGRSTACSNRRRTTARFSDNYSSPRIPNASGPCNTFDGDSFPQSPARVTQEFAKLGIEPPVLRDSYPAQLQTAKPSSAEPGYKPDRSPLPPTAIGLSLLEIYFARVYNAPLMFHKATLFQQYLEGELHSALLGALLALATLFLSPKDSTHEHHDEDHKELRILSIYHSSGLMWAEAALTEAARLVMDSPTLMVVQALECLQLYWFGIGHSHRANLCLSLAYRSCTLLGYGKKVPNEIAECDLTLESELGRRCFWACWTSICIVMEPEPYIKSCWQEAAMIPLPGFISNSRSDLKVFISQSMDKDWRSSTLSSGLEGDSRCSEAAGFLVKMIGVWAKVQLYSKDYAPAPVEKKLEAGDRLSHQATALFDAAISFRSLGYDGDLSPADQALLLIHDTLYHQCQIIIYSMIVPSFSGIVVGPVIDPSSQQRCAKIVANHADLFGRLLEPYFCGRRHISFLPPLVGYGAFVTGIVFLVMELSCLKKLSTAGCTGMSNGPCQLAVVKSITHLLDGLRVYWKALERPWKILFTALQKASLMHNDAHYLEDTSRDQSSVHTTEYDVIESFRRNDQNDDNCGQRSQPPDSNEIVGEGPRSSCGFRLASTNDLEFEVPSERVSNNILTNQEESVQDDGWFGLSYAEADIDLFDGLDPAMLF